MRYDFDQVVDRAGTGASKYDTMERAGYPQGSIPMWVADMDFKSPPCVLEALRERIDHGVFGYSDLGEQYSAAVIGWYQRRFGWKIQEDWIVKISGVVFALHVIIEALSNPGDAVLVQQPVYMPFFHSVDHRGRKVVVSQLKEQSGEYSVDLEDFEQKIISEGVKLFILCNPHNPISRVWTRDELAAMGEICLRHGVIVIADEIHADFVYPGNRHTVFASISQELAMNSVTCTAPSKTFNLAGLQASTLFIPNEDIRAKVKSVMANMGIGGPNLLGQVACAVAYEKGDDWVDELIGYLRSNADLLCKAIDGTPLRTSPLQGTYLMWLDCRALGMRDEQLADFFKNRARLFLSGGAAFGSGGEGFMRMNIGLPRSRMQAAVAQLSEALASL